MKKENLFAHIESLDELKPYICPKAVSTRDWEFVCQECKGKCDAGKRAIQILDEATKPDIPKKAGKGIISDAMRQGAKVYNEKKHLEAVAAYRGIFNQAVENDQNPVALLAEIENVSYHTARQRLDYFIKQHPEIDAELHMRETMNKYVKRRKSRKAKPDKAISDEMIPGPVNSNAHAVNNFNMDEISIGDILKAADEGRVKTDSVEETEAGVQIKAHIESAQKQVNEKLNERQCVTLRDVYDQLGVPYDPDRDYWINPAVEEKKIETIYTGTKPQDNVNCPSHYTFGAIEVIDYIRDKMTPEMFQGFCMGNVLKYVSRHKHKNGVEDLKKANVYLGWLIESEEGAE